MGCDSVVRELAHDFQIQLDRLQLMDMNVRVNVTHATEGGGGDATVVCQLPKKQNPPQKTRVLWSKC